MAVLLDRLTKEGSVPLERYGHQVGGHYLMFKFKDTLCKPVIPREHFFYQTAPEVIKRYMPGYHGVIIVSYVRQPSGIQVVASSKVQPVPIPPSTQLEVTLPSKQKPMEKSWGKRGNFPKCTTGFTIHSNGSSITSSGIENGDMYQNPWSTMCSFNMDERLKELGGDLESFKNDYMILENLTSKYQSPCVLDLKVGTRQHGDSATPYKIQKHMYTCSTTTSRSLGVRMAGMQKFDALKNEYVFYDKYFGKQLTIKEFSQVMRFFLTNGVCFRSDLVPHLVRMLEDLSASIKAQPTFRYFSSSLLILYDGAVCPEGLGLGDGDHHFNFDDIVSRAQEAAKEEVDYSSVDLDTNSTSATVTTTTTDHRDSLAAPPPPQSAPPTSHSFMTDEELTESRRHVDVRMIDFAHATHAGCTKDPVSYEGVDEGYIHGLQSLIQTFRSMGRTCCENGCGL